MGRNWTGETEERGLCSALTYEPFLYLLATKDSMPLPVPELRAWQRRGLLLLHKLESPKRDGSQMNRKERHKITEDCSKCH